MVDKKITRREKTAEVEEFYKEDLLTAEQVSLIDHIMEHPEISLASLSPNQSSENKRKAQTSKPKFSTDTAVSLITIPAILALIIIILIQDGMYRQNVDLLNDNIQQLKSDLSRPAPILKNIQPVLNTLSAYGFDLDKDISLDRPEILIRDSASTGFTLYLGISEDEPFERITQILAALEETSTVRRASYGGIWYRSAEYSFDYHTIYIYYK